jgi:hypothetical protein
MMIFRFWSMLFWSVVLWVELFAYTILTIQNQLVLYRAISVALLFFTISLFIIFISCGDSLTGKIETDSQRFRKYQEVKSWLLFAVWAAMSTVVLFMKTLEVATSLFVLVYITTTAILTSIIWCVVSRAKKISDASWHWYVWSMITFIAIYSFYAYSFHNFPHLAQNGTEAVATKIVEEKNNALYTFVGITVVFALVQVAYIYDVCRNQNPGHIRSLHLCRIIEGSTLALFSMISCLLFIHSNITFKELELCVVVTELALLLFVVLDAFIGFRNDSILVPLYGRVKGDDIDDSP